MLLPTRLKVKSPQEEPILDSPCETRERLSRGSVVEFSSESTDSIFPSSPGYFEDVLVEDGVGLEFHFLNYIWCFSMGFVGALDMMACLLPPFVVSFGSQKCERSTGPYYFHIKDALLCLASLLDCHSFSISFTFSAMWFADAFVEAQTRRAKFLMQEERCSCLAVDDDSLEKKPKRWWETASFVYYRSITLQLLLLPVGFYFLSFYLVEQLLRGRVVTEVAKRDEQAVYEKFSTHAKVSLLFAIIQEIFLKIAGSTSRALRSMLSGDLVKRARLKAMKKLVSRAIKNPLRFRRNIQKVLTAVRWIKYLAPLIGPFNKLKANVSAMRKRRRQTRLAQKQKRVRRLLREGMPVQVREGEAARLIQSVFRASIARKSINALKALQFDKHYLAAMRLQRAFRSSLSRTRNRLQMKKEKARRLSVIRNDEKKMLDRQDQRRFYELQDELAQEAEKMINRKLLLRPNSKFSVSWRLVFIGCILVEISYLLSKPWRDNYTMVRKRNTMTMSEFIALKVKPTRASLRPECGFIPKMKRMNLNGGLFKKWRHVRNLPAYFEHKPPWYCNPPGSTIQDAYSDVVSLMLVPAPLSEWPDCRDNKRRLWAKPKSSEKRWYCHESYVHMHALYHRIFDFVLEEFLVLVSLVCFLDVFVVFFTGDLDELTGVVVPKPFVARWIAPGLLLQLLLNPQLGSLEIIVAQIADEVIKLGPIRVLRWSVATIFPVVYFASTMFIKHIWMPIVHRENKFVRVVNGIF